MPNMNNMTKNKALHNCAAGVVAIASETAINANPGPVESWKIDIVIYKITGFEVGIVVRD